VINGSFLSTRFISLVYGELEQNGTFVYVNAGHNVPFLVKQSETQSLGVGGTILGPVPDMTFKRGFAFLDVGDVLVLYTDGIVEREDPKGEPSGQPPHRARQERAKREGVRDHRAAVHGSVQVRRERKMAPTTRPPSS